MAYAGNRKQETCLCVSHGLSHRSRTELALENDQWGPHVNWVANVFCQKERLHLEGSSKHEEIQQGQRQIVANKEAGAGLVS